MAQVFDTATSTGSKADRYGRLAAEIAAVLAGESDQVARMATVAAMLATGLGDLSWVGFYLVDPLGRGELVVGPYQGALGCLRIALGRGVCGQAAARRQTLIVPDVDAFDGHIACDPKARSEIVAPVFDPDGALIGVCDLDSMRLAAFDEVDARGLENILRQTFAS